MGLLKWFQINQGLMGGKLSDLSISGPWLERGTTHNIISKSYCWKHMRMERHMFSALLAPVTLLFQMLTVQLWSPSWIMRLRWQVSIGPNHTTQLSDSGRIQNQNFLFLQLVMWTNLDVGICYFWIYSSQKPLWGKQITSVNMNFWQLPTLPLQTNTSYHEQLVNSQNKRSIGCKMKMKPSHPSYRFV